MQAGRAKFLLLVLNGNTDPVKLASLVEGSLQIRSSAGAQITAQYEALLLYGIARRQFPFHIMWRTCTGTGGVMNPCWPVKYTILSHPLPRSME